MIEEVATMQELIQSLAELLTASIMYQEKLITKSQRLGMQSEKREARLGASEDLHLLHYVKCYAMDRWQFEVDSNVSVPKVPNIAKFEDYFNTYKKFLEEKQTKMAEIVNKLYAHGAYSLGDSIKRAVLKIDEEIIEINRDILEGRNTQWSAHALFTRHVTAENKHDKYEKKERDCGYEY